MRMRPAALALLVALLLPAAVVMPAGADDPEDRQRKVDRQARALRADLHEHTAEVASAVRKLDRAQAELQPAKAALDKAQGAVQVARQRDVAAAAKLEAARSREGKAVRELGAVQDDIAGTQELIGKIARDSYQRGGSLGELSVVMGAESPQDLANRVAAVDTLITSQSSALDRLDEARAGVAAKRAKLEAARAEVATLRERAAARLAETKTVEARAADAERRVSRIVSARRVALADAEEAKAEDERRYQQLRSESRRLEQILQQQAGSGSGGGGGPTGAASSDLMAPVSGPVTSPYGMRVHPITGEYKLHDGTDFGVGCGVPIRAATDGRVVRATALTGYGNQVALDHGSVSGVNLASSYNHLSGFAVNQGEQVSRGEVVGYVGSTGYSTGCHLHFMVYENGGTVDPMKWL